MEVVPLLFVPFLSFEPNEQDPGNIPSVFTQPDKLPNATNSKTTSSLLYSLSQAIIPRCCLLLQYNDTLFKQVSRFQGDLFHYYAEVLVKLGEYNRIKQNGIGM